jgi:acetoin utilization protein AcuB
MLVKHWMTANPVTARPDEPAHVALERMHGLGFRHLPVVDGCKLVGVVSHHDLTLDLWQRTGGSKRVDEVMHSPLYTVSEDTLLEDAVYILIRNRINALPVIDADWCLRGIITSTDFLCAGFGIPRWQMRAAQTPEGIGL